MRFSPRSNVQKRARILTRAELNHVIKIAGLTRDPERNRLLLYLTHALGLRVSECARSTVRDFLFPSGRIREELTLRSEITKFNRSRTLPISSQRLIEALDTYLDHRVRNHIGVVAGQEEFRGLSPDLPLIMSERGTGLSLVPKQRRLESGEIETYFASDPLENCFRRLYRSAGLHGASSHSGRRYYATTLTQQGTDIETISHLLGHVSIDHTVIYTVPSQESIKQAFEIAL